MSVKQLPGVFDFDMLQRFEFERYLFDHAIPRDQETLSGTKTGAQATSLSQSGTAGMLEYPSPIAKAAFRVRKRGAEFAAKIIRARHLGDVQRSTLDLMFGFRLWAGNIDDNQGLDFRM
jgi:hypothetical protein